MDYETTTAKARMLQEVNRATTATLKGSIELQQMTRKLVDKELQVRDLRNLVEPLLQELEARLDNGDVSPEIAKNYINLATFMKENFQREDYRRIEYAQAWLDSPDSLPFK